MSSDENNNIQNGLKHKLAGFLCVISAILVFILPFKFGGIVGIPEVLYFPEDIYQWAIFAWPPVMFPVMAAILLMLSIFATSGTRFNFKFVLALIWVLLAITSLIGFINASTKDFPIQEVSHFFGIACFCMSIYFLLECRPDMRNLLLNAVVLSVVVAAFMGLQQLLWGFKETMDYVYRQELESGLKTPQQLQLRLVQTRVYTPFTLCNSLAAHLVLTIPLCIALIWQSRLTLKSVIIISATFLFLLLYGYCTPAAYIILSILWAAVIMFTLFRFPLEHIKSISMAVCILCALLMFSILYFTGSRAAVLSFGLAIAVTAAIFPFNMKIRIISVVSVLAATAVGFYFINAGRHLGSMAVRFDYFEVAAKLFSWNVFFGTGWGDFFHQYPALKMRPGPEAPHSTHNFILDFASQTGAAGMIVSAACIIFPLILILMAARRKDKMPFYLMNIAIILGWTAWALHSLADINCQVPGTVATAILMIALLKFNGEKKSPPPASAAVDRITRAAACLIAIFTLWISGSRLNAEYYQWELTTRCEPTPVSQPSTRSATPEQIEAALQVAIAKMPYSPFPWASAGNYAQSHKRWASAELFFQNAVGLSPERSSFYHRLFVSQMMLGKKKEAAENIRKAYELFPSNEEYKYAYEQLSKESGK